MNYKISDLAKLMDVSTNTVRRYESFGYFKSKRNEQNSYRIYDEESIFNAINARLLRSYGFSHDELATMKNFSMEDNIQAYEHKMKELEKLISNLQNTHHRLKDDIILMHKSIDALDKPYFKTNVDMFYSFYAEGDVLVSDPNHQKVLNTFVYEYPEIQRIYLMKKKDIDSKKYTLNAGWSVKGYIAKKFNVTENEYVKYYPSMESIMCIEKIEVKTFKENNCQKIYSELSPNIKEFMKKNNCILAGDVLAVSVSKAYEGNKEMLYLLLSVPICHI